MEQFVLVSCSRASLEDYRFPWKAASVGTGSGSRVDLGGHRFL